jgi:ubiquinone/menaquinone biosynthesis C-methylase UbiE
MSTAPFYEDSQTPVVAMDRRHTMRLLACKPGERILDAGCGNGRNLAAMIASGARPSGWDLSPEMLAVARRRFPEVPLYEGDLQLPGPFGDGEFDAVLCALVAEHLPDPLAALHELLRVLRPGGRLVWSVSHPRLIEAGMQVHRLGALPHTAEQYEGWIQKAGFSLRSLHEYIGDEDLIATVPLQGALVGSPVLLVIEARKRI